MRQPGMGPIYFRVLLTLALAFAASGARPDPPYRFLLVVSDQWKDPASFVIEDGGEFPALAALMKSWGLPFDILAWTSNGLDRYHLLDRDGRPRYGTIIWDPGRATSAKGIELLPELVKRHGVNLVVLADTAAVPEAAELAGVRYVSDFISADSLALAREHFITRGLDGREKSFLPEGKYWPGNKVAAEGAAVLLNPRPASLPHRERVERRRPRGVAGRAPRERPDTASVGRDLFKRCLVWAQGLCAVSRVPQDHAPVHGRHGHRRQDLPVLTGATGRPPRRRSARPHRTAEAAHAVMMQNVNHRLGGPQGRAAC